MSIDWRSVLPVIISIGIIIAIAIARHYAKALAPILATMPVNITLAMWIVNAADPSGQAGLAPFVLDLFVNLLAALVFLAGAWLAARAGWSLGPVIVAGYVAWGVALGAILLARRLLGG